MSYVIEFENEGEGIAFGVYVTDVLDENLDDATLVIKDFQAVDYANETSVPTTYPYSYDSLARTLTVLIGEAGSRQGGRFTLEARLKPDVQPGTFITNQAIVYFPTVLEETPTNTVVSVVPVPTQLAYAGDTSVRYSDYTELKASVASGGKALSGKAVEFEIAGSTFGAVTDTLGSAAAYPMLDVLPGTYAVRAVFPGDGYLYLASSGDAALVVEKEDTVLSTFSASVVYPATATIVVMMTDDEGDPILHQEDEPKTVYLERGVGGTWELLGQALLVEGVVTFEFLPDSVSLTQELRARFEGDDRYNAALSTGVLTIIDGTPPDIDIQSPRGGEVFAGMTPIIVSYTVTDDLDPAPSSYTFLTHLADGATIQVVHGEQILPFDLTQGSWTMTVEAEDWAGNRSSATTPSFEVVHDALPPRTAFTVGAASAPAAAESTPSTGTVFVRSDTPLILSSIDDLVAPMDGIGLGTAFQEVSVDGYLRARSTNTAPAARQTFVSTFTLASESEGTHDLALFAEDVVGNRERVQNVSLALDDTKPISSYAFDVQPFVSTTGVRYVPLQAVLSLSAEDPVVSGAASGLARIEAAADGAQFTDYELPLSFAEGPHTVPHRAVDRLGNMEDDQPLSFHTDDTPPVTAFTPSGTYYNEVTKNYAPLAFIYTLPATDPVVSDVASGVKETLYTVDGALLGQYTTSFSLTEGIRRVDYQSKDNVLNTEFLKSATVHVDATPPATALRIVGGRQYPGPDAASFYASTDTVYELPATDPVVEDVASGIAWTQYAVSTSAYQAYTGGGFTLTAGVRQVNYHSQDKVGNLEVAKSTTVLVDDSPPVTTITVGAPLYTDAAGIKYITPQTPIDFAAADPRIAGSDPAVAGSGVDRIELSVDGGAFEVSSGTLALPEGRHTVLVRAVDNVGNMETTQTLAVRVDATAPDSVLDIGEPTYMLPEDVLLVSGRTEFDILSADPEVRYVASGVKETLFRIYQATAAPPAFSLFTGTFTLSGPVAPQTIDFFARDNVENTEIARSSTVLLDAVPPVAKLLCPGTDAEGICSVFNGIFPILGAITDHHFREYHLEWAPGINAVAGFVQISSGTSEIEDGALGVWDTSALSGLQTLRLTGEDLVENVSVVRANVLIGDPARQLVLGGGRTFNHPEGVAGGPEDGIYVADTNNDRIRVFDSSGTLVATFDGKDGHEDDEEDNGDDDEDGKKGGLDLNKPKDVAVDALGNIYVADTHHHRIVKLSSAGVVLLDIGDVRLDKKGKKKFHSGKAEGAFKHPEGVALDAAGNIYVADSGNHRVQVFGSDGAFLRSFLLPAKPEDEDHEDGDEADEDDDNDADEEDDDDDKELGKPVGIDVDAAGNIYVADPKGRRAYKFGPLGDLLLTIGRKGKGPGEFKKPAGIAVSPLGDCILVSDRNLNRVQKFNDRGELTLVFGEKGKIKDKDPLPAELVFKHPIGLAMDGAGRLLVADRNNERVQRFGLPEGTTLVVSVDGEEEFSWKYAKKKIKSKKGGEVVRKDKTAVDIPPDALPEDTEITISPPETDEIEEKMQYTVMAGRQLGVVSEGVEYGPEGLQFSRPVTITLAYDPSALLAEYGVGVELNIHYWNPESKNWEELESTVDPIARTVSAQTYHFSQYQVLAPKSQLSASADFVLGDVYVFPNPAVRGAAPTFHIETGIADTVNVRIYDIAGQLVHENTLNGGQSPIDDGSGADYAYEYAWRDRIASGVYLYVVTTEKGGRKLRRTGKFALVR